MAIEIKGVDGWKAALNAGVSPDTLDQLKSWGVTASVQPSKFAFMQGKETLSAFMVKSSVVTELATGTAQASPGVKQAFQNTANMAVQALPGVKAAQLAQLGQTAPKEVEAKASSTLDLLLKTNPQHTIAAMSAASFAIDQMQTAPPVPLAQAQTMYQPVVGTSSGSRYFVVAMRPDLKIAARLTGGKLSVRAEGEGLSKFSKQLTQAGFGNGDKYRSLHVSPGKDLWMAGRTLGSILVGLDIEFQTMAPKVGLIANKGG